MITKHKKANAYEAYAQHRKDINSLMLWLELELAKHRINAKSQPNNFGMTGDLECLKRQLTDALASLSHSEPNEIQDLLSNSR